MADRISPVEPETADDLQKVLLDGVEQLVGRLPNSFKIGAHAPFLQMMLLPFIACSHREGAGGTLSAKIMQLVVIKVSQINDCGYCLAHNTALGEAAGITEKQVETISLDGYTESPLLNEREKAAVLWAEHVTLNTARARDDVFERVKSVFSDSEIIELTFLAAYFNMRNRFNDSLSIPIEPETDVGKIKKTKKLDTGKLKRYLQHVLDHWPESFPEPNPDR